MRRRIFNIVLLLISFCLMLSVSFGWWIEGVVSDSFVIKSAKISSEITIYKGNDFNHDGILDKTNTFELVEKKAKNKKQVLILQFDDVVPTEVYTWKIKVDNNGDAAGFVYATLVESLLKDVDDSTETLELRDLVKFMSISYVPQYAYYLNSDGTLSDKKELMHYNNGILVSGKTFDYHGNVYYVYKNTNNEEYFVKLEPSLASNNKVYLYNATASTVLFGNTTSDIVDVSESKEYVFQIQLEPLKNLETAEIVVSDSDKEIYQKLQGASSDLFESIAFEFIDVSLSGTPLGDENTTAKLND